MKIRVYEERDAQELAELYVTNWQKTYRGMLPDAFLDGMNAEDASRRWNSFAGVCGQGIFVAEQNGVLAGFAAYRPDENSEDALYLDSLHVSEKVRGQGIGTALIRTVGRHAANNGFTRMTIRIVRGNDKAGALYRKLGAVHVRHFTDRFGDTPSDSEELVWNDLSVFR